MEKLQTFHIDEKHHTEYRIFMEGRYKERQTQIAQEKRTIQRNKNNTESKLTSYVVRNASIKKDKTEERIYIEEKKRLENLISGMEQELSDLTSDSRNEILEFESFFNILNNADMYYKNASYVQKRLICRILFSNILLTPEKTLQIAVKP